MADKQQQQQYSSHHYRVVVVGGGLAGLAATRMLTDFHGLHDDHAVLLLEAGTSLGGRVKHITGLAPWPVEVGPEFIHGTMNSSFKDIADKMGCRMRELPYPDRYYLGSERRILSGKEAEEHEDIQLTHKCFQEIASEDPDALDISMCEYLRRRGANATVTQLAESVYANDFGCSLKQLGVRECIQEAQNWTYGDTYLILDRPMSSVVDFIAKDLKVRLDWAVQHLEYATHGVKLQSSDGRIISADYVILTVPVSILQHGFLTFSPSLPKLKLDAINSIGMNNCVKVLMAFSDSFWPNDMFDVVCTNCFLPEFWVTQYPSTPNCSDGETSLGKFAVVGFMAGESAAAAAKLPEAEVIRRSLLQLDEIFGQPPQTIEVGRCGCRHAIEVKPVNETSFEPKKQYNVLTRDHIQNLSCSDSQCAMSRPASAYFRGGCVVNWEKESFVRGGYTHPSVNAHGARTKLAEPLLGRVFFAGEATHPESNIHSRVRWSLVGAESSAIFACCMSELEMEGARTLTFSISIDSQAPEKGPRVGSAGGNYLPLHHHSVCCKDASSKDVPPQGRTIIGQHEGCQPAFASSQEMCTRCSCGQEYVRHDSQLPLESLKKTAGKIDGTERVSLSRDQALNS